MKVEIIGGAPVEGGVFLVRAQSDSEKPLTELSGTFRDSKIEFFPLGQGGFGALIGVEYGAQPTPTPLRMQYKLAAEESVQSYDFPIGVNAAVFPSEKLRVPPRTIEPKPKDKARIKKDNEAIRKAYATITERRYWDDKPIMPVNSQVTSVFGTSRVYNGKKHNAHLGTDLRAPTGTRIVAPVDGKVVLVRDTFYLGNTVILDHGYGVFTIYGHLSKAKVKQGSVVKRGNLVGLAGATGRVSGPHLHWAAHMNGVKVDPLLLINAMEALGDQSKENRWIASP